MTDLAIATDLTPDYARLIDAQTWAFIHRTSAFDAPDGATLDATRAAYDRMARAFHHGRPPGVSIDDRRLAGVSVRVYEARPVASTVLYLHGGGFVVGGLDSHDDVCAEIAVQADVRVVCPDYRLAPEHPHPAAFDDCMAVVRGVAAEWPGGLILVGDSAGGTLAAAVAHRLRDDPVQWRLRGQVLIYPALGGSRDGGSAMIHARAPLLTVADLDHYSRIRHGGPVPRDDPTADPLHDRRFDGLPPTAVFSAECDPLADDGRDYRDRIVAAGGTATWHLEHGLVHGYLRARHAVSRARESFTRIVDTIRQMGSLR